ncbi:MAG: hypothetical protein U5S82_04500 [Gammaproteobacteria bacterium]|nr:hypothetical protein [Gammaproteobacteria bacterium]
MRRFHARIVQDNGLSLPLDQLFPEPNPRSATTPAATIARGASN